MVTAPQHPILPGSSPILTCSIQLAEAANVEASVYVSWTGPTGAKLLSGEADWNGSSYTSSLSLIEVDSIASGNYKCTTVITSSSSYILPSHQREAVASIQIGQCFLL